MVTVPTGETASINFFLELLIQRCRPAMLLGPAGVGKTAIIMGKLRTLNEDIFMHAVVNVNYFTNFASLLKQRANTLAPLPLSCSQPTPTTPLGKRGLRGRVSPS